MSTDLETSGAASQLPDLFECELTAYRKGFIQVTIDLARRLITWKDSNHWFNNYVRILSEQDLQVIARKLPAIMEIPAEQQICPLDQVRPHLWKVVLSWEDRELKSCGYDIMAPLWSKVLALVEVVGRRALRL